MSLLVGLTGGIGSGKTHITRLFQIFGIPVFNSDHVAAILMDSNPEIIDALNLKFGSEIYIDGRLNRKLLAQLIFKNPEKKAWVDNLVHPLVREELILWRKSNLDKKWIVQEAAILFESGAYKNVDKIVTVVANVALREMRVTLRDNRSSEEFQRIVANQWSDDERISLSDFVIYNNENDRLIPQVLDLFNGLEKL